MLADEVAGRVMVPRRFRTFTSMTFPVDRRVAWVDLRTIKPAADVVAALIDAGRTRPHDIVAIHDADGWTHTRTTKMIQRLRAAGNG